MMFVFAGSTQAQLSIRLNLGTPPQWGPSGYDQARYYYLPDIQCYYDVPNSMFIYYSGRRWIRSRNLPERYRDYDLYNGYKVVINDYRGNTPYYMFRDHRMKYPIGYRGEEQHAIRERYEDHRQRHEDNQEYRKDNHENEKEHDHGHDRKDRHDD